MRERPRVVKYSCEKLWQAFIAEVRQHYRSCQAEWLSEMFAASPNWDRLRELHQEIRHLEQRAGRVLE